MSEDHFAMISDWMINGNITEFLNENPGANRLGLVGFSFRISLRFVFAYDRIQLEDVARGLIYIHRRGIIHGDLKGVSSNLKSHSCI
jgi:serine/threonine protein kinase